MDLHFQSRNERAITLVEVLLVVAVVVILAGLVVPGLVLAKAKANRITCVSHLKCVGLAFRIFSTDNRGDFPWRLSGTNGTKDILSDPTAGWRHFQFVSNELSTPLILSCPSDRKRSRVSSFASFGPGNLSYFLGLLAEESEPQTILCGDRNLTTNGMTIGSGLLLLLPTNQNAGFSKAIHQNAGNLLLGDGSVQQVTSSRFQDAVYDAAKASANAINRLLIP